MNPAERRRRARDAREASLQAARGRAGEEARDYLIRLGVSCRACRQLLPCGCFSPDGGRMTADLPARDAREEKRLAGGPSVSEAGALPPITGAEFVDAIHEAIPDAFSDLDGPLGSEES